MKLDEMKAPRNNDILKHHDDIAGWLSRMKVKNFEIENGIVNCKDRVDLSSKSLAYLPVQFGVAEKGFNISKNRLTSLRGCPHTVGHDFDCSINIITSFEFVPRIINDYGSFDDNKITSLVGVSDKIDRVKGDFYVDWRKIKAGGIGILMIEDADIPLISGNTKWAQIIAKYNRNRDAIFECQTELIDAGFEAHAEL